MCTLHLRYKIINIPLRFYEAQRWVVHAEAQHTQTKRIEKSGATATTSPSVSLATPRFWHRFQLGFNMNNIILVNYWKKKTAHRPHIELYSSALDGKYNIDRCIAGTKPRKIRFCCQAYQFCWHLAFREMFSIDSIFFCSVSKINKLKRVQINDKNKKK